MDNPKYYFQLTFNVEGFYEPLFAITPIEYFVSKGFLWDRRIPDKDLPTRDNGERAFDYHFHGYYSSRCSLKDGLRLLWESDLFRELDMHQEIWLRKYGLLSSLAAGKIRRGVNLNPNVHYTFNAPELYREIDMSDGLSDMRKNGLCGKGGYGEDEFKYRLSPSPTLANWSTDALRAELKSREVTALEVQIKELNEKLLELKNTKIILEEELKFPGGGNEST